MATCIYDKASALPVCEAAQTRQLHALLRQVVDWFLAQRLTAENFYDDTYASRSISAADVVGLSRTVEIFRNVGVLPRPVLLRIYDPGVKVNPEDVRYVADNLPAIVDALRDAFLTAQQHAKSLLRRQPHGGLGDATGTIVGLSPLAIGGIVVGALALGFLTWWAFREHEA